jgi:hypothetical protein
MRSIALLICVLVCACTHVVNDQLQNPAFERGVKGWRWGGDQFRRPWRKIGPEEKAGVMEVLQVSWSPVTEGLTGLSTGARQCVAIEAGKAYDIAANVYVPPGQSQAGNGEVWIQWWPYRDCSKGHDSESELPAEMLINPPRTPAVTIVGKWVRTGLCAVRAPVGALSAEISLTALNRTMAPDEPFIVLFDDVLFAEHAPDCSASPANHSFHRTRRGRLGSLRSMKLVGRAGELRIR